jgi:hypothetical protein
MQTGTTQFLISVVIAVKVVDLWTNVSASYLLLMATIRYCNFFFACVSIEIDQ